MENVLVVVVPREKDWKILKEKHWYRMPVKSAPKVATRVNYFAFYQPKVFGKEKWAVNYYAEIKSWEIVKRIELLPDEPNHVNALNDYYKFSIGELKKLPHPIPSKKQRRIVFIPTTLDKLLRAKEINDLYHTSPIEEKLYTYMRKENIPVERQFFVKEGDREYCLDFAILDDEIKIDVECNGETYHSSKEDREKDRKRNNELASYGWRILRFSGKEIYKDPEGCIKKIRRAIKYSKRKSRGS